MKQGDGGLGVRFTRGGDHLYCQETMPPFDP
jgi:hypothetical protein